MNKRPPENRKPAAEVPLVNVDAERIIIGKMLENEAVFWELNGVLLSEHFSVEIHRDLFDAIYSIATSGKRVTLSLIVSRIGPEYGDGASTMTLMTALMRNVAEIDEFNDEVRTVLELWQRRRAIEICNMFIKEAKKEGVDTSYMLFDMENCVKDITVNSQAEPIKTLGQFVTAAVSKSSKAANTGQSPGFDTGLASLDEILGRIHGGDFGVIGARQGDAKTVLGVQLARRADAYGIPSAMFELEMQGEDLGRRVLAGETNISVSQIEEGSYEMFALEELKAVQEQLKNSRVHIDDRPKLRIDQIRDRCVSLKRTKGLGIVVIDHLRLVRANGRFKDKFDRIEFVTGELKSLAKELDIAVIALSQVTRSSQRRDDPSPQLNDFDGGPSIEQDADWAIGMFRRDRWLKTQRPRDMDSSEGRDWLEDYNRAKGKIEIRCLKRRRGDDGEMREFTFDGRRGLITEIER